MVEKKTLEYGGFDGGWPNVSSGRLIDMTRPYFKEIPSLGICDPKDAEEDQMSIRHSSLGKGCVVITWSTPPTTQRAQHRADMAEWWREQSRRG